MLALQVGTHIAGWHNRIKPLSCCVDSHSQSIWTLSSNELHFPLKILLLPQVPQHHSGFRLAFLCFFAEAKFLQMNLLNLFSLQSSCRPPYLSVTTYMPNTHTFLFLLQTLALSFTWSTLLHTNYILVDVSKIHQTLHIQIGTCNFKFGSITKFPISMYGMALCKLTDFPFTLSTYYKFCQLYHLM